MNNVVDIDKNRKQAEIHCDEGEFQLVCQCTNNTFTFNLVNGDNTTCVLQCTKCHHTIDACKMINKILELPG